ncbi:MAG: S9 family peptidase [Calditrichia bacterium]
MKFFQTKRIAVVFFFLIWILPNLLLSQEKQPLTIEWIYSSERRKVDANISPYWLKNGEAIIYDHQKEKNERTLERLNPENGMRAAIVDASRIVEAFNQQLGEKAPEYLEAPDDIDEQARWALYLRAGDIFLLNLQNSELIRVTQTEAKEKSARFSPDGRKFAFVRDNNLYVYHIDEKREIQLTFDGSDSLLNGTLSWVYWEEIFGRHDIAYWWSGDSRALAYLQTDESHVPLMHYVDFKPQTPRLIKQRYPKAGQKNPSVKVGIIELDRPTPVWVKLDTSAYEYLVRVKWLPDNQTLACQTLDRPQTQLDLYFADRKTGTVRHILTERDPGWVNIHDDLHFIPEDNSFIWASERSGYNHLYRYSLEGRLINQITSGDWSAHASFSGVSWLEKSVCAVDEKSRWIYFTGLKESSLERHLYRVRFDGSGLERLTQEKGVHRISFSPDARFFLDTYSNRSTPPAVRLHRQDGSLIDTIATPDLGILHQFELQFPEIFTIAARDGFPLPACLLKPADFRSEKRYPVIVYVYGGPAAPTVTDSWSYHLYFDNILVNNGYLVFSVDNRSASAIAKKYTNLVAGEVMGDVELNDFLDGIRWLKSQTFVDSQRVGVWGWSGGGMHTLLAMTRSREFKAGIAVAAVSDWQYYDTRYTEFGMKTPQSNPDGYEKTSLVNRAQDLHGRLLLVHGTYDDNVHIQNTWAFANQLIKHNIMFDMMIYPMRKHGIGDNPARIHLYHTMLEFWKRNL